MTTLDRKVLRDARRLAAQLAAVAVVMACGVAVLVMAWSMLRSLAETQREYAEAARFADVFAQLKRAPEIVARRLEAIPGIERLETRVVADVTLVLDETGGRRAPAVGRLVSLPEPADDGGLNRLALLRGRLPDAARPAEAVVGEGFAAAHGLGPGGHLFAVLNGRRTHLDIVGVATSPEYVYTIGPGGPFPDDRSFGVLWMGRRGLAAAFDMADAFNDVVATLAPGGSARDVCHGLDRELDRYGGRGAFGREFQTSHRYLTNELRELANMSRAGPVVFLAVTAILMHLVVSRLVGTQREQIATLAAFGLSPREIGAHYVKLALVVLACGAALGVPLGWWLGVNLAAMYARFFRFPALAFRVDAWAIGWSVAVASAAALAGVGQAVARAVRIRPAAAMQPEPPAAYRPSLPERLGLAPLLAPTTRMMLRHLERRQEIMAPDPEGELLRILDRRGRAHDPRTDGLVLSRRLAELLGARPGDALEVEVHEGRRPRVRLPVAGTVDDMVGTSAWLHPAALARLLGEAPTISGAFLAVDAGRSAELDARLADSPRVAGFVSRELQVRTFRETIARTLLRMRTVNTLFAVAIACGVVATTARQSLIERGRDLASLRVLGYTRSEVAAILLGEQAILTLAALPPGLLLGHGLVVVTTWGYDTELFRVPAVVHPRTYAVAAATVLGAALVAAAIVRRRLDRLDLVGVLKARD